MVIAPASTGRERRSKMAVSNTDHTKRGVLSIDNPLDRMLRMVVMKFADPMIEEAPAKCNEKMAKSTDDPACAILEANGG
jgi:hypothetical protein